MEKQELTLKEEVELMDSFEVEELEKRYEMGWGPSKGGVKGGANHNGPYGEVYAEWTF